MASEAYRAVKTAAEKYLRDGGSVGPKSSKNNKQILEAVKKALSAGEIPIDLKEGSILSYLSYAANQDLTSRIVSGGVKQGYWYDASESAEPEQKPLDQEKIEPKRGKPVTVGEKDLYPLVELWLESKGYTAKDMSSLRAGGRWGNPDIIGVDRVEALGCVELELASCEVKLSDSNWEQYIFEGISHKRFSNRSWFCYRVASEPTPLPKGIEYYAERYRVGVVQIVLNDDEMADLKNGKRPPIDFMERVIERVPALFDLVPLREQRDLIERTGIALSLNFSS